MKNITCIVCKAPMEDGGYIIEDVVGYPSIHDGFEISFHLCDTCITGVKIQEAKRLEDAIAEAKNDAFLNLLDYFASQIYVTINEFSGSSHERWVKILIENKAQYLKLAESVEEKFLKSTNDALKKKTMNRYSSWKKYESIIYNMTIKQLSSEEEQEFEKYLNSIFQKK